VSPGYLLDTTVLSELTKLQPESNVVAWVNSHSDLHLSVITLGELRRGFELMPPGKRRNPLEEWFEVSVLPIVASRILPITPPIAERWGVIGA
jgi:predicted nucleic acid-binding protein